MSPSCTIYCFKLLSEYSKIVAPINLPLLSNSISFAVAPVNSSLLSEEVISLYDEAQKLDSELKIAANDWNIICWFGSLNNQAKDVIFACENAVKFSPDDGNIRGISGLARALTGDYQGAIEDFQVLVDSVENEKKKAKYKGWI